MLENILQLTAVVVVFVLVLAGTYYVTKWIAKSGMIQSQSRNIKVIETFKITNGKYIQIIQLGKKYYSIGVTKDQITFLTPLKLNWIFQKKFVMVRKFRLKNCLTS